MKYFALSLTFLFLASCGKDDTEKNISTESLAGVYVGEYNFKFGTMENPPTPDAEMTIETLNDTYCRVKFSPIPASPGTNMTDITIDSVAYAYSKAEEAYKLSAPKAKASGIMMGNTYIFDAEASSFAGTIKEGKLHYDFNFKIGRMPAIITAWFDGVRKK